MNLTESLSMAVGSLRTNKMRSFLTLLGVIIGIAAVIAILTLGKSLQSSLQADLDKFGANNFSVTVEQRPEEGAKEEDAFGGGAAPTDPSDMISPEMLQQVREGMGDDITGIIIGEYSTTNAQVQAENAGEATSEPVFVRPTNPDYVTMSQYSITAGRSLTEDDIESARTVVMVSEPTAQALFGSAAAAPGQYVTVEPEGRSPLELQVIGVYKEPKSGVLTGDTATQNALIPYSLEAEVSDAPGAGEAFTELSIRAAADADKAAIGASLQRAFDAFYADNPDYHVKVKDFSEDLASLNQIITTMSVAVAAIGGISLLVGGIGVMNIMLITVTERTREIGVRKALGARRRDIRVQFVTEAVIVCLIGGAVGIVLGSIAGVIGSALMGFMVAPPLYAIVVSVLFSLSIGLFFGYYPAGKAARLDPIEALRYE